SDVISAIVKYENSGEINFRIEKKQEAMDVVRDYFSEREEVLVSLDFDGYRVEFADWWFNIRPSNTEPYLRFLAEARSVELLESKISKVKELLQPFQ
ncbi:MAG: hypothetical protein PHP33_04970, partial [Bacteroidales bacterium]|nr:hypothetical protein [Bacteroidales bacterium]